MKNEPDAFTGRIRTALAEIAQHWPDMIPVLVARSTGTIGRSPERADPIRADVVDLRLATTTVLTTWAKVVAEERGLSPAIGISDVPALTRFLDAHAEWLADHEASDVAHAEITTARDAITALVQSDAPDEQQFVGPCVCGTRLHAARDTQWLCCATCGRVSDRRQVRAAAHQVVRDQLCTAAEAEQIAAVVGVQLKRNTVTTWARRSRLAVAGVARDGSPTYRWRDIEQLAGEPARTR